MIIASPKMQALYEQARRCAPSEVEVLLLGESGTGKEVLARAIHQHSRRAGKPFVAVNCGSIPTTLVASEFFGHERGAFTDARQRRIGRFEQAHGGTLFLDEIGDLSLEGQVALLRALETRRIERVGAQVGIEVDLRVIAATNQDLRGVSASRSFEQTSTGGSAWRRSCCRRCASGRKRSRR